MNIKTILQNSAITLLLAGSSINVEAIDSSNLIEGFAKWQADRIEKVIIDEAIGDIAEDRWVKRYFSNTAKSISLYDNISATRLIPLIKSNISKDLAAFDNLGSCLQKSVDYWMSDNDTEQARADHAIKIYSALRTLTSDPNLINEQEYKDLTVQAFITKYCNTISNKTLVNISGITDILKISNLSTNASKILMTDSVLNFEYEINRLKIKDKITRQKGLSTIFKHAEALKKFIEVVREYKDIQDNDPAVMKVHRMLMVLEYFGITEDDSESLSIADFDGFGKLKNVGLFFAALSDASDSANGGGADAVKGVLEEFVADKGVFKAKRSAPSYYSTFYKTKMTDDGQLQKLSYSAICSKRFYFPCNNSIFFSSYYGFAISEIDESGGGETKLSGRAFGPIGFEFKLATFKGSPLSLNYAPIDIGNYVTAELKGESYDAKIDDIIAPSVFLAWSAAEKPFSLLFGYQRDIKIENGLTDNAYFLSVAFDLPIATIY